MNPPSGQGASARPNFILEQDAAEVEQETFGVGEKVIEDEKLEPDHANGPHDKNEHRRMFWYPTGMETDPLCFVEFGAYLEPFLPRPEVAQGLRGILPPQYTNIWPEPGHLCREWREKSHLRKSHVLADQVTENPDPGFTTYEPLLQGMFKNINDWYTWTRQTTAGYFQEISAAVEILAQAPATWREDSPSQLHEILRESWSLMINRDPDLEPGRKAKVPMPQHTVSSLHHFESEFKGINPDPALWPSMNQHLSMHDRIELCHSRLRGEDRNLLAQTKRLRHKATVERHQKDYDVWTRKIAHHYLVPHINLEELNDPTRVMQFIYSRMTVAPVHFIRQDFISTYLGRALRILTGPFSLHTVTWDMPDETDEDLSAHTNIVPRLIPYNMENASAFYHKIGVGNVLGVGDCWVTFKAQAMTYTFLRILCMKLMQHAGYRVDMKFDTVIQRNAPPRNAAEVAVDRAWAEAELALGARDKTPVGLLASSPFLNHWQRVRADKRAGKPGSKLLGECFITQANTVRDHLYDLIHSPRFFHERMRDEYNQHYSNLFPDIIKGEDQQRQLFVDSLRSIFRKALTEMHLLSYVYMCIRELEESHELMDEGGKWGVGPDGSKQWVGKGIPPRNIESAEWARGFMGKKTGMRKKYNRECEEYKKHIEDMRKRKDKGENLDPAWFQVFQKSDWILKFWEYERQEEPPTYQVMGRCDEVSVIAQVRGMIALAHYVAMVTRRCLVPSTAALRKHYAPSPEFMSQQGSEGKVSNQSIFRHLPKRHKRGERVGTRLLRRGLLRFPKLKLVRNPRGKEAVMKDQRMRSLHRLLVDFLSSEEIINTVSLGQLLRRINALRKDLETEADEFQAITPHVAELLDTMSLIFVLVEQESVIRPFSFASVSGSFLDHRNASFLRILHYQTQWRSEISNDVRMRLDALDELPLESRIDPAIISALYDQQQIWDASQSGVGGPNAPVFGDVQEQGTIEALDAFWKALVAYLREERSDGQGKVMSDWAFSKYARESILTGSGAGVTHMAEQVSRGWQDCQRNNVFPGGFFKKVFTHPAIQQLKRAVRGQDNEMAWHIRMQQVLRSSIADFYMDCIRRSDQAGYPALKEEYDTLVWREGQTHRIRRMAIQFTTGFSLNLANQLARVTSIMPVWLANYLDDDGDIILSNDDLSSPAPQLYPSERAQAQVRLPNDVVPQHPPEVMAAIAQAEVVKPEIEARLAPEPEPFVPVVQPQPQPVPTVEEVDVGDQSDVQDEVMTDAADTEAEEEEEKEVHHYWWFESLAEAEWEDVARMYKGFVDEDTGMRQCRMEIPQWTRNRYAQNIQTSPEAPKSISPDGKFMIHKKSVKGTFEVLYSRELDIQQQPNVVTGDSFKEFMAALGWGSRPVQGSEVRFTYNPKMGRFAPDDLKRHVFVLHMPHAKTGRFLAPSHISAFKKRLVNVGLTYAAIDKNYMFP